VHAIQELAALARAQLGETPVPYPGAPPGSVPGYLQEPTTGPIPDRPPYPARGGGYGPDVIGRKLSRRMQRAADRVQPALAARQEVLRTQIAIADKYPDLRACLSDAVIFLAGGTRLLPLPDLSALTMQQADDLVATLRSG